MDKAQIIERMALVADDQPSEVAQPGKEALNLPAAAIASERTTGQRRGFGGRPGAPPRACATSRGSYADARPPPRPHRSGNSPRFSAGHLLLALLPGLTSSVSRVLQVERAILLGRVNHLDDEVEQALNAHPARVYA